MPWPPRELGRGNWAAPPTRNGRVPVLPEPAPRGGGGRRGRGGFGLRSLPARAGQEAVSRFDGGRGATAAPAGGPAVDKVPNGRRAPPAVRPAQPHLGDESLSPEQRRRLASADRSCILRAYFWAIEPPTAERPRAGYHSSIGLYTVRKSSPSLLVTCRQEGSR